MRTYSFGASPPITEKTAKIVAPIMKIRLRPSRSASRPPVTIRTPKTSAYALITHWTVLTSVSKSSSIAGRLTLSAEKSFARMITLSPSATNVITCRAAAPRLPPRHDSIQPRAAARFQGAD